MPQQQLFEGGPCVLVGFSAVSIQQVGIGKPGTNCRMLGYARLSTS
jgi:hypothetical protein